MRKRLLSAAMTIFMVSSAAAAEAEELGYTPDLVLLTEAVYESIGDLSEGLMSARIGGEIRYLNTEGREVISDVLKPMRDKLGKAPDMTFVAADKFHEGLARITYNDPATEKIVDYTYFIDKTGKMVFDIGYENYGVGQMSQGMVLVYPTTEDFFVVYDKDGKFREIENEVQGSIHWLQFSAPDEESQTTALLPFYITVKNAYTDEESVKFGYYNQNFVPVITAQFEDARPFNGGYAFVKQDGLWGVIDRHGKFVSDPECEDFYVRNSDYEYEVFAGGWACVKRNGKWGYQGRNGTVISIFKYGNPPGFFREGFVSSGEYGIIAESQERTTDMVRKVTSPGDYDDLNYFVGGVALAGLNGVYRFINTNGEPVYDKTWRFESTVITTAMADSLGSVENEISCPMLYGQNGKVGLGKIKYTQGAPKTAIPAAQTIVVNGKQEALDAYNINGSNYIKLRDIACVLNGTEKQFNIEYTPVNNETTDTTPLIQLYPGFSYTQIPTDMQPGGTEYKVPLPTDARFWIHRPNHPNQNQNDPGTISPTWFSAYNIDGSNYFKLRDIGEAFDFGVIWDGANNTVVIDTSIGYTPL